MTDETQSIATARRGIVDLVRGWAPFVGMLAAYEVMRGAASALGVQPHNLAPVDRHLFGFEPTLILQAAAQQLADADLLEDVGSLVYGAHFLLPVAIGIWLWTKDRDAFSRFGFTLVILCAMAFATFVVAPTSPPWLAQPAAVRHVVDDTIQRSGLPGGVVWLYSHHDYNLYAAFPSLHAAFPVVAAAAAWQQSRVVGILLWAWAIVVWVAVVYLGEHYVTDVVGGLAYAAATIVLVKAVIPQRRAALAEPPGVSSNVPSRFQSARARRLRSSR